MSLRDKLSNAKRKLSSDARAPERGASSKVEELKRRARQDVKTAERRARSVDSKDVKRALRKAGKQVEGVEGAAAGRDESEETFARAEDNAMMGAPLDADLSPTTSPQDMQNFVTSTGQGDSPDEPQGFSAGIGAVDEMVTSSGRSREQDPADDLFSFGGGGDRNRDDGGNPLEFDSFGDGNGVLDMDEEGWF